MKQKKHKRPVYSRMSTVLAVAYVDGAIKSLQELRPKFRSKISIGRNEDVIHLRLLGIDKDLNNLKEQFQKNLLSRLNIHRVHADTR